jgi:dTDP-4-dehydrorhamnose reductase
MFSMTFLHKHRILMTGITSIHGWPVYSSLRSHLPAEQLFGCGPPGMRLPRPGSQVETLCITDKQRLEQVRQSFKPSIVIHAAGVCDLDICEERPHWADRINRIGSATVAEVFGETTYMLYLSTDLVFSGNIPPVRGYNEKHPPDPVSVAGKTFLAGEQAFRGRTDSAVIRLGLPMGRSVTGTKGGLDWIEGRFRKKRPVTLFHDEYRSVIPCEDLARCVIEFLTYRKTGLYHLGGPEAVSLHGLGRRIIEGGGYPRKLLKGILRHEEENGPPRIGNVMLDSGKIGSLLSFPPTGWRYAD